MSSSEQVGIKRGVRIGIVFLYLPSMSSSHLIVSSADASGPSSTRKSGLLRSIFTFPTMVFNPVSSIRSMSISVASL